MTIHMNPNHLELADAAEEFDWGEAGYEALKAAGVAQVSCVPDKGHARLIQLLEQDPSVEVTILTTEEEGIAISAGNWLGGQKSALLIESSGVGNCVSMVTLGTIARFPIFMLVAMQDEWGEFNPWQMPMAVATYSILRAMGANIFRISEYADVRPVVASAAKKAFEADQVVAVLVSPRLLRTKTWGVK